MWRLAPIPFLIHALGMLVDEAWYHRRRGLPAWERWGHPLDTLTVLACYALALSLADTHAGLLIYLGAAAFSSLFIIKDEWVHVRRCTGGEMALHAFLFMLHPILLGIAGAWRFAPHGIATEADRGFFQLFLTVQTALTAAFLGYQLLYWNGPWKPTAPVP